MRKTHTRFEQVPVELAEKILKLQHRVPKRESDWKLEVGKTRRMRRGSHGRSRKVQVSTS
jgi:hypothetical protein